MYLNKYLVLFFLFSTTCGMAETDFSQWDIQQDLCQSHSPPNYKAIEWEEDTRHAYNCGLNGVWLPEDPPIFRPFVADPREICYSVGWRFHDQALDRDVIDVSFGDTFGVYEWFCVWPWNGKMRIELEGAAWAVFAPCQDTSPLLNTDYYVGIPITFEYGNWQFRLRFSHISSHVGDEFLVEELPKGFERLNPSAEYVDFFFSYDMTDDIRVYWGVGYVMHQDESFRCGRWYSEGGGEVRWRGIGFLDTCNQIYGTPFFGMYYRFRKDYKHHVDSTYALGYEWGKLSGLQRRLRAFVEYHDGYSVDGQFFRFATNYISLRLTYGY